MMTPQILRKILPSTLLFAVVVPGAWAETARPTDPVYGCLDVADDAARLACFDKEVAALRNSENKGEVQTVDKQRVEILERDAFGLSLPSLSDFVRRDKDGSKDLQELELEIARAYTLKQSGDIVVVFKNGQVWRQIDTEKVSASRLKKAEVATIKRASFGSFLLSIDGARSFRARREQ